MQLGACAAVCPALYQPQRLASAPARTASQTPHQPLAVTRPAMPANSLATSPGRPSLCAQIKLGLINQRSCPQAATLERVVIDTMPDDHAGNCDTALGILQRQARLCAASHNTVTGPVPWSGKHDGCFAQGSLNSDWRIAKCWVREQQSQGTGLAAQWAHQQPVPGAVVS